MKKKRRNFGGMMMMDGMGMMGQGHTPTPTPLNNPILLLTKFPALAETSIPDQDTTKMTLTGRNLDHGRSVLGEFQAIGNQFALIVNVVIYNPGTALQPIAVFDTVTNTSGATQDRLYHPVFQSGFGKDQNAYQHAMFYLSDLPPLTADLTLTVKHPPCKRRVVTVEQWANVTSNPLDQQALMQSTEPGVIQITSGQTSPTAQPFELIYGSIAIGRDFDQFSEPQGFIPIQNVGSNIDSFDVTLKTYYQVSAIQNKFGLSALVSSGGAKTNFVWSAALQTFRAIRL